MDHAGRKKFKNNSATLKIFSGVQPELDKYVQVVLWIDNDTTRGVITPPPAMQVRRCASGND